MIVHTAKNAVPMKRECDELMQLLSDCGRIAKKNMWRVKKCIRNEARTGKSMHLCNGTSMAGISTTGGPLK
jgi:hypothetical protein